MIYKNNLSSCKTVCSKRMHFHDSSKIGIRGKLLKHHPLPVDSRKLHQLLSFLHNRRLIIIHLENNCLNCYSNFFFIFMLFSLLQLVRLVSDRKKRRLHEVKHAIQSVV